MDASEDRSPGQVDVVRSKSLVERAEFSLKQALEAVERHSGKKKPKEKTLKQEQQALAQALSKL